MVFSRHHIHNIAKKNFIIDFELLSVLNITKTEAIILDHISYFNKVYGAISLNISQFVGILQISRQHFYRCIKKLIHKNLISKDNKNIEVTKFYEETKVACFKNAHNRKVKQTGKQSKYAIKNDCNEHENLIDNLSHNVTEVSQNVTLPILYNTNKNFMCVLNTHKENIKDCKSNHQQTQQAGKFVGLLNWCNTKQIKKGLYENILKETEANQLRLLLQNKQDEQIEHDTQRLQQSLKEKMNADELEALRDFSVLLAKTGMFLLPQNQKTFVCHIEKLIEQKKNLKNMIAYSKENNCLWICDDENDDMGMQCLKQMWECVQLSLKEKEQETITHVSTKHRHLLLQFMNYRQEKGRAMNEFSLKRLCLVFNELEQKGINLIDCVNQSIERGYNWVFKPTHNARFFNRKLKNK
ncbi:hypothetical protein [Helicobacter trogontum]|uniref:hypothetical protein n=1 Tax=Helicobacter trogontum TaxID=50960 RepID=UPI0018F80218|nr:hypothetical protein [Helicobacter trogontum]